MLFGESLGAHTSQDVFLHWGTLGLQALGIDRALWIGTPYGSEWMHEVTGPERLDVDRDRVAVVNDLDQLRTVTQERGALPPYVMLSHDNDGVTKFGPDLLTTAPAWLGPQRPRVERRWGDPASRQRTLALVMDAAAVPAGLALQRLLPSHPGEAMARGWTRQAGWRAATTGIAALSLEATRGRAAGARRPARCRWAGGRAARRGPLGLTIAFVVDRRREVPDDDDVTARSATPPLARSVLVAGGVEGGLAAVAYAEHALAGAAGRRLAEVLPGGPQLWRLVAHGASLGAGGRDGDARCGTGRCGASRPARPPRSRCSVATRVSGGPARP